jgi:hypothetical protein
MADWAVLSYPNNYVASFVTSNFHEWSIGMATLAFNASIFTLNGGCREGGLPFGFIRIASM